jgi:hypothetical protein
MIVRAFAVIPDYFDLHTRSYRAHILHCEKDIHLATLLLPWPSVVWGVSDDICCFTPIVWISMCCMTTQSEEI